MEKEKNKLPYQDGIAKVEFDKLVAAVGHDTADAIVRSQFKPKDTELLNDDQIVEIMKDSYSKIISILKIYCDLDERYYPIIALWILGTYTHEEFNAFPFLFINAMRGSGKTRLLKLISALSKNGDIQASISEAVLFRTAKGSTVLLDEMESIGNKEKGLLRELLNGAYKKGLKVKRMKKGKDEEGNSIMEVEEFDLFTPIAIANINGLDDVLSDRCIPIILEKSTNKKISKMIEDFESYTPILELKRTLLSNQCRLCSVCRSKNIISKWNTYHTLHTHHTHTTQHTQPTFIQHSEELTKEDMETFMKIDATDIDGRNLELFFPLFMLSRILDNGIMDGILLIAKQMVEDKKQEETTNSPDVMLYTYLATQSPIDWNGNYVSIAELLSGFKSYINEESEMITAEWLGRALRRLKLVTDKKRKSRGVEVMLDIDKARTKVMIFRPKWNGEDRRKEQKPLEGSERRRS